MSGIERIAAERRRQIEQEGWTPEHDDTHKNGELAVVAAELLAHDMPGEGKLPDPWGLIRKHGRDRMRRLEIAGALIAAEIDRMERAWREQAEPWGKIEYAAVPVFGVAAAADWRLKVELIPVEHWQPRDDRAQAILRGRFNAVARWIGRRLDVERVHERCRQDGWRPAALAA